MKETTGDLHGQSIQLSNALVDIGLDDSAIRCRRKKVLLYEKVMTSRFCKKDGAYTDFFVFGSQVEGSTTPGLNSDIDKLFCCKGNVIQSEPSWKPAGITLLMLQDSKYPGYCRLQPLQEETGKPFTSRNKKKTELWNGFYFACDEQNGIILRYKKRNAMRYYINKEESEYIEDNGPAISVNSKSIQLDYVFALKCTSWLKDGEEWIHRDRRFWPSNKTIQTVVSSGFFVVPVGHKLSPTRNFEWRISFSFAERELMFSLETVHIKVYVVLKMLKNKFITSRVRYWKLLRKIFFRYSDCISSYHCKTALFYCVEETDPQFWRDDNIINCVTKCLKYLLRCVREEHCPHYILPKSNLFAGKVTARNKKRLISILEPMTEDVWRYLIQIPTDNLSKLLQRELKKSDKQTNVLINSKL